MNDESRENLLAWTSLRSFVVLAILTVSIAIIAWDFIGGIPMWQWYLAGATALTACIMVLLRRRMSAASSAMIFFLCSSAILVASGLTNSALAHADVTFDAFLGYKLLAMAVAIIAPYPVWMGFVIIGVCAVGPVAHYLSLTPALRAAMPVQEPWAATIYAVIAVVVLWHRLHGLKLERTLARAKAEQRAVADKAAIVLGLRDLTNTPLQAIELTAELLASAEMTAQEGSIHLERSMKRLRQLSQLLMSFESGIDRGHMFQSFDAVAMLQDRLGESKPAGRRDI